MKLIAAVDENWGIGNNCKLLQVIPADMEYFKAQTIGKVVIMGKTTFESLPGKRPLADRINIVLSKTYSSLPGVVVCASLTELFYYLKECGREDIFVIGGESVYCQLMTYCSDAYITKIRNCYPADRYLPNLDKALNWKCIEEGSWQRYREWEYRFTRYKNLTPLSWK